jgi:hypothetical protein
LLGPRPRVVLPEEGARLLAARDRSEAVAARALSAPKAMP